MSPYRPGTLAHGWALPSALQPRASVSRPPARPPSHPPLLQHYREFKQLLETYGDAGLVIQLFPCNQFGQQESGTNEQIKAFAAGQGFKGLLMDKLEVNGANASPVWRFLKVDSGDTSDITWNFEKARGWGVGGRACGSCGRRPGARS